MNLMRVGVLMGGKSIEREVSFNSGRTICDHLDTKRYEVIPLFQAASGSLYILPWGFLHRGKISDFEHRLAQQAQHIAWDDLKNIVDFVYIAMHGQYAEDGSLQGFLEILGIPYLGSGVLSSALGMDKHIQKDILRAAGIAVPKGILVSPSHIEHFQNDTTQLLHQLAAANIHAPYIIKPYKEGSSLGVNVVFHHEDLQNALVQAMCANPEKKQPVVIEEKIEGMEFSCVSLFDHVKNEWVALPATEVVHQPGTHFFDYEQKYMPGKAIEFTPARCSATDLERIQNTCIATTKALHMQTISRVDGFLTREGTVIIVDPNSLSGMAPASFLFREAAHINMNHPQLINHLIACELDQYGLLAQTSTNTSSSSETLMAEKKLRVAVLMGGRSNEKEISLESGRNVCYKLDRDAYDVLPLFVSSQLELFRIDQKLLVRSSTCEIEQLISPDMQVRWNDLPELTDFVFIALHGGEGENGCVQGTLEMLGLPYNGSGILTSALCMDKFKTNSLLASKGFDVPKSILIGQNEWASAKEKIISRIARELPMPIIVKPHDDGCSVMVHKIDDPEKIDAALETLFNAGKSYALVEECISGMELTVGVMGNDTPRALVASQAVAKAGILSLHEKFLPGAGENQTPAPLPTDALLRVNSVMERVYQTVGCKGYARIDCFYQSAQESNTGQERVIILEINTLPAMTPATCIFHQAAELGIKPREFIRMIITYGLEQHQNIRTLANQDASVRKPLLQ